MNLPAQFDLLRALSSPEKPGSSSTLLVRNKADGAHYVLKPMGPAPSRGSLAELSRRRAFFAGVSHPGLGQIAFAFSADGRSGWAVRPFLRRLRKRDVSVDELLGHTICTLEFLRRHRVAHRAVKLTNLLVRDGKPVLVDPYLGPIAENREDLEQHLDAGSLPGLIVQFITGLWPEYPPPEPVVTRELQFISAGGEISRSVSDCLRQLLANDPKERIDAWNQLVAQYPRVQACLEVPLLGRDTELDSIVAWASEQTTRDYWMVHGEPGCGRSAVLREAKNRLEAAGLATMLLSVGQAESLQSVFVKECVRQIGVNDILGAALNRSLTRERTVRSLVGGVGTSYSDVLRFVETFLVALLSVARRKQVIVLIDDLHLAHPDDYGLVTRLLASSQSAEKIRLIASASELSFQRSDEHLIQTVRCSGRCRDLWLRPLTQAEMMQLADDLGAEGRVGNGLNLENPKVLVGRLSGRPEQGRQVISEMKESIAHASTEMKKLLAVLSLRTGPCTTTFLSNATGLPLGITEDSVEKLTRLGLLVVRRSAISRRVSSRFLDCSETLPAEDIEEMRRRILAEDSITIAERGRHLTALGEIAHAYALYRDTARTSFQTGDYEESARFAARAVRLVARGKADELSSLLYLRARALLRLGRERGAAGILKKMLRAAEHLKDRTTVQDLRFAISRISSLPLDTRMRLCRQSLKDRDSVLSAEARILRLVCLAQIYLEAGRGKQAKKLLQQAGHGLTQPNQYYVDIRIMRCFALLEAGDYAASLKASRGFDVRDPFKRQIWLNNAAICAERLGNIDKARSLCLEALETAVRTNSDLNALYLSANAAALSTKLSKFDEARSHWARFESLASRQPRDIRLLNRVLVARLEGVHLWLAQARYREAFSLLADIKRSAKEADDATWCCITLTETEVLEELGDRSAAERLLAKWARTRSLPDVLRARLYVARAIAKELVLSTCRGEALRAARVLGTFRQFKLSLQEFRRIGQKWNHSALDRLQALGKNAKRLGFRAIQIEAELLHASARSSLDVKRTELLRILSKTRELELKELEAETCFRLGSTYSGIGGANLILRSVAITQTLAEGLREDTKDLYLAVSWRREAFRALGPSAGLALQVPDRDTQLDSIRFLRIAEFAESMNAVRTFQEFLGRLRPVLGTARVESVVLCAERAGSFSRWPVLGQSHSAAKQEEVAAWIGGSTGKVEIIRLGKVGLIVRGEEHELRTERPFLFTLLSLSRPKLEEFQEISDPGQLEAPTVELIPERFGLIGASRAMQKVYELIEGSSNNSATVLIEGESGTGKELVARAIHNIGPRKGGPFTAVDCGAIPEGLIETELFGNKKGAYTGAVLDRSGLFEAASGGTLFLDEIANMSSAVQAKLLRVLQDREVRRVGETKGRPVNVRIIAATNVNLEKLVQQGKFRQDLLFRLKVLHIPLPPLRKRREDIPLLVQATLDRLNETNRTKKRLSAAALERLRKAPLPGNVRELQNSLERAFYLSRGPVVNDVPLEVAEDPSPDIAEATALFQDLTEGKKDFWMSVQEPYKKHDLPRGKVTALVDLGLKATHGSYKKLARLFRVKEYRRLMDFLRRNECQLDFRPYRKRNGRPSTDQ